MSQPESQMAADRRPGSESTSGPWFDGWKAGVWDAVRALGAHPMEYGRIVREHRARWCMPGPREQALRRIARDGGL